MGKERVGREIYMLWLYRALILLAGLVVQMVIGHFETYNRSTTDGTEVLGR
jgi:hypothetical protein